VKDISVLHSLEIIDNHRMRNLHGRSVLFLSLCSLNYLSINAKVHYRFQSGNTGVDAKNSANANSYGSSLHYDSENGLLYVTGKTYSHFWSGADSNGDEKELTNSDCFLTILKVPEDSKKKDNASVDKEMKMLYEGRFGKEGAAEGCSAVMDMPSVSTNARAITMGNTEEDGLLTSLRSPGSRKAEIYGFMMDFDIELTKKKGSVVGATGKVNGGRLLYDSPVQYPIALTSDPLATQCKEMYAALLTSPKPLGSNQENSVHSDLNLMDDNIEPGQDFRIVIEMTESKSQATLDYESAIFEERAVQETLVSGWKRSFSPNAPNGVTTTLQVSGLVYVPQMSNSAKNDVLVLTGTTNGYGPEFGGASRATTDLNNGFITKLNPTNGSTEFSNNGSVATTRVGGADDTTSIHGICFQENLVDVEYIYVVGYTDGLLDNDWMQGYQLSVTNNGKTSKHAFVAKIRLRNLSLVWARQLGSQDGEDMIGQGCDVTPDGNMIYLAGTIKNGGSIRIIDRVESDSTSAGGDDIFVASYSTTTGAAVFIKQFGTTKDDSLAGGKGIVSDEDGNAIVLGNTRGSMMRLRAVNKMADVLDANKYYNPYDIFVMSVGKTRGKIPSIAESYPLKYSGESGEPSKSSGTDQSVTKIETSSNSSTSKLNPQVYTVEAVAIAISCLTLVVTLLLAGCSKWKKARNGELETNSTGVVYSHNDHNIT